MNRELMKTGRRQSSDRNSQPLNTAVSIDVLAPAITYVVGRRVGMNVAFSAGRPVDCVFDIKLQKNGFVLYIIYVYAETLL
jgi:hypothetical protein